MTIGMFRPLGGILVAAVALVAAAPGFSQPTIRLAHHVPTESEQHLAAERFAERVADYSGGDLQVQVLPAGQMGGQREIVESVQFGTLEMGYGESGLYANYVPAFGILTLPYLYSGPEHWSAVVDGDIGAQLAEQLRDAGDMRVLNWILAGYRDTYLTNQAVERPEDFSNIRIRVPESPVFIETFAELGAQPTPIPAPEIYTALQTGVVDAMEGTPELAYTFRLYEVANHLSRTRHILFDGSFVINETFFQSLSPENQDAVQRAAEEVAQMQRDEWADREANWFERLASEGIEINEVDMEAFRAALSPVQDRFAEQAGAADLLEPIRGMQ
jgi:tripartite ATP-independent transporter DctP family solute receptor